MRIELYITRHGQTDYNLKRIVQGRGINSSLNENGQAQAAKFYEQNKHIEFDALYASAQQRSQQSIAAFETEKLSLNNRTDIDEMAWGKHEGMPGNPEREIAYREMMRQWNIGNFDYRICDESESPNHVKERVQNFLNEILVKDNDNKRILICTHGRTITIMMCLLLGWDLRRMREFRSNNLKLYKVIWENGQGKFVFSREVEKTIEEKISMSAVAYLNTKPFLSGLESNGLINHLDLQLRIPSAGAAQLLNGEAEIGLIPVAVIPDLEGYDIFGHYCIGTEGAVKTVCLYSHCPLEEIETVYLDFHSRTSVQLLQILFDKHWKKEVNFLPAHESYHQDIKGNVAGLIIGDRAIDWANNYTYEYDLGTAWKEFSGLPFVFAAWVAKEGVSKHLKYVLNDAFAIGISQIEKTVAHYQPQYGNRFDVHQYLTQHISYELDDAKQAGLELFLSLLEERKSIEV